MMKEPYVVTEDVEVLMNRWGEPLGLSMPDHDFFAGLQKRLIDMLKGIYPEILLVPYKELLAELNKLLGSRNGDIIVSLDRVYNMSDYMLECNRVADPNTSELIGEAERPNTPSLVEQIRRFPEGKSITLIDDGVFTGDTLKRLVELLNNEKREIAKIVVGILVNRSGNVLVKHYPEITLQAVYEFDSVKDWLCERDFFIGVPLSGRTAGCWVSDKIHFCTPEVALPYCFPYGDPVGGASIPEDKAEEFSEFIVDQSIKLWEAVGEVNGRPIMCSEIPRFPKGAGYSEAPFVDSLRSSFAKYKSLALKA